MYLPEGGVLLKRVLGTVAASFEGQADRVEELEKRAAALEQALKDKEEP